MDEPGRHRDGSESKSLERSRRVCGLAAVITAALVILFHHPTWNGEQLSLSAMFFIVAAAMLVLMLATAANGPSFRRLPVADGKVVALVPTYNEDPTVLHACLNSLLAGSRVPDVIHVVDDGSVDPPPQLFDRRIVWHRTANQGKRAAQIVGLDCEPDADFVLTVDSDSIVDEFALEEILRPMSEPAVQAVTGTCLVRNRTHNLVTRLTDLEFVGGNFVTRRARSRLGAVAPTSGPLALYRAEIVRDNRDDYLTSGTYGDDRRLTHYSLLRGRVVMCDRAIVEMEMPTTLSALYRQRVRWFKGYVKYLPWELAHLSGAALALRVWNTALVAVMPLILAVAFVVLPIAQHTFYWQPWLYWCALLYAQTLAYAAGRPRMSAGERWLTWLIGTPMLIGLQFFVLRPALFNAVLRVRNDQWVTRDPKPPRASPVRWPGDTVLPNY